MCDVYCLVVVILLVGDVMSLPWHHSNNMALPYRCITIIALTSSESVDVCTRVTASFFSFFFFFFLSDSSAVAYFLAVRVPPVVLLLSASSRSSRY